MAKRSKEKTGLRIDADVGSYRDRCIVFDQEGIPWVIDPKKGTIAIARILEPAVKK